MYRVRAILALLLFLSSASLWAQSDDATLINITTLTQLDAIHYDLDGDGTPSGSTAEQTAYRTAFGLTGMNNNTCTGGCVGYELRNDLDFEDVSGSPSIWSENCTDGACQTATAVDGNNADKVGWKPIGGSFTAAFDGRDHTISNLYINRPSTNYVSLFGLLGTGGNVRNLGIEGGSMTGSSAVGGLVGQNSGTISACYATGNASGSGFVGGLVGFNQNGTISACYATGNATGTGSLVGGLVGRNDGGGTISACYATGNATGTGSLVGGLVGQNRGTISACYATGNATGANQYIGGLVGDNAGTISASYATGDASGTKRVGGLVGWNGGGAITNGYATGDATGTGSLVGGLVGGSGTVTNSYFDSSVSNRTDSDDYAKTTTELQTPTAYAGIYSNWNIDVDNGLDVGVDNGTEMGDATADDPWDFGTNSQYPALKVDFNVDGTPSAAEFGTQASTASLRVSIFTPERGVVGATVTIIGKLFSTTAADNTVTFLGDINADADNAEAMVSTSPAPTTSSLTVTVPTAAQTGPISVMAGAAADTSSQDFTVLIAEDKDTNDNGLIEVSSLGQLDAMRYDLDGDGVPSGTDFEQAAYRTAFVLSGAGAAASCTGSCKGYELMSNLDFEDANGNGTADDKSIWAEGASAAGVSGAVAEGWVPIGYYNSSTDNAPYTATFEGNSYTISNLYIDRPSTSGVGLFGALGSGSNLRNLGIVGGSLTGAGSVGGLVGRNEGGTIMSCYATGDTSGTNWVGGLVGRNEGGTIIACYATRDASGNDRVGGLVGWNDSGTIIACYATGDAGGIGFSIGGLVGNNSSGTIIACYATGDVSSSSSSSSYAGGLVGWNGGSGTISACYATGDATATGSNVGGLVGLNDSGTISACYATGDASGSGFVGGLVGQNDGTISACYATGDASGSGFVGGLVGWNSSGTATNSYFDSSVSNRPDTDDYAKTTAELQTPTAYGTAADIYANWNVDVDNGLAAGVDDATMAGDDTADDPWDFGTSSQYPALRVDFNVDRTPSVAEFGMQPRTAFKVSSFTPEMGTMGTTVTIRGKLFSTTAAENTVTFLGAEGDADNAEATVSTSPAPTTTELTVTVPPAVQTGPISVMVGAVADTSSQDFTVLIGEDKDANDNGLIEVRSLEQLHAMRYDLDGDGVPSGAGSEQAAYRTAFGLSGAATVVSCTGGCVGYELMSDLDFDNVSGSPSIWSENCADGACQTATAVDGDNADKVGWEPIGYFNSSTDNAFYTATFDGRGHTISNLYINRSTNNVGLFGVLGTGGNVRNLGIEGGSLTGADNVGGLAGFSSGTIRACYATGDATGSGAVGGLVGWNEGGAIRACYATGTVTGSANNVGGLAGSNAGTISACSATGDASGGSDVGGLVGVNQGTISACYATGDATGSGAVGGLAGSDSGTVTNSYFDSSASNRPDTDDYAKTTAELQTPTAYGTAMEIYATWNIDVDNGQPIGVDDGTMPGDAAADDPWDFGTESEYPALKVDFDVDGASSVAEFGMRPRTAFRISSFTPERGIVGATVTIRGKLFSATAADNTVTFLGAEGDADNAEATVSTSPAPTTTELTVTVPPNAQTGPISVMVGAAADTSSQDFTVLIGEDKDANDNGLIEVSSLEQLDAIRYDLDGDGIPSGTDSEQAAYRTAFGLSGAGAAASCTGDCVGYELMNNLDKYTYVNELS